MDEKKRVCECNAVVCDCICTELCGRICSGVSVHVQWCGIPTSLKMAGSIVKEPVASSS